MKRIYLDYAATTPTHPEVVKAMLPYFTDAFGNPSSIHFYGQEAKGAMEEARTNIASLITDNVVLQPIFIICLGQVATIHGTATLFPRQ